ncbi:MAG: MFS transporter [Acidimicrobiales bacterium]
MPAPTSEPSAAPAWRLLAPLYLLTALGAAGYGAIFTLAAAFRDEFGFSDTGVGLIVSVGFASGFVTQVALSRIADRGHALALIRVGIALLLTSMIVMATGTELWHFVIGRALLGMGSGMIIPGARRVAINLDPERMGANLGMLGSFQLSGFIAGPALAAVLNEFIGLRAPFIAMAALTGAAALLTGRLPADTGARTTEKRIMTALLRLPRIRAAMCMTTAFFVMVGTWESLWAVMLTDLGSPTWVIGFTLSITSLPMIALGPRAGRLAQERGALKVAAAGLLITVPCMAGYGLFTSVALLVVLSLVQSIGDAFAAPASRVAAAVASPPDQHASAQGLLGATEVLVAGLVALPAAASYQHFGAGPTWAGAAVVMIGFMTAGLIIDHRATRGAAPEGPVTPLPAAPAGTA